MNTTTKEDTIRLIVKLPRFEARNLILNALSRGYMPRDKHEVSEMMREMLMFYGADGRIPTEVIRKHGESADRLLAKYWDQ